MATPSYRLHRPSGQAVVTLRDSVTGQARDVYLGAHDSQPSREAYYRELAAWEGRGRRLPLSAGGGVTIDQLADGFLQHIKGQTDPAHISGFKSALALVRRFHGSQPADEFGPKALRTLRDYAVREKIDGRRWSRPYINTQIDRLRRVWRWGVSHEMVKPETLEALMAVEGLRKGRTTAPEPTPVEPVGMDQVQATLPHLPRDVRAMVEIQALTGARAGEIVIMRGMDIQRHPSGVWLYRPASHKTAHKGKDRVIGIGPTGQRVLLPFLIQPPHAWVFPRPHVPKAKVQPERYTTETYRMAIHRACRAAGIAEWNPHQVRHARSDELDRLLNDPILASKALGHSDALITRSAYTTNDLDAIIRVAREVG